MQKAMNNSGNGDPFGCYTSGYPNWTTGDPPPFKSPTTSAPVPSIMEQMGVDPVSKLAAAIEKLADAIKGMEDGK